MKLARRLGAVSRARLAFASVVVGMVGLALLLWELFGTGDASSFALVMAGVAAVVGAAPVAVAQLFAASKARENTEPALTTAGAITPEIAYWPPDINLVFGYVTRLLFAVDDICRGLPPDLSEASRTYVEQAIDEAKAALGSTEREFSARLRSLGLDPRILIGPLRGRERAVSDWTSGDRDSARMLDSFRSQLLDRLGSDQASFLPESVQQFFQDARSYGKRDEKKFSRKWAGVLTLIDAGFGEPSGPETETSQARDRCRLPPDKHFIGRSKEIKDAADKIESEMKTSGSAVVWVTGQQLGVGVSMMTRKLARTLYRKGLFNEVLYFNLEGLAGEQRVTAADVVQEVLATRDVKPGTRPFVAYKAAMRNKHILLVLDDAADEGHVAPLAKQMDTCCVLVASRNHNQRCADFAVLVGPLLRKDSIDLLLRRAGPPPRRGWPASIRRSCGKLAEYVDDLPIALQLVGARIAGCPPGVSLTDHLDSLEKRLENAAVRLANLEGAEKTISKAIELSYVLFDDDDKRLLRMCHAARDHDVASWELAFCLGREEDEERFGYSLDNFVDISLARVKWTRQRGRPLATYTLFNLIRWYAAQLRREEDVPEPVGEFTRRFVCYMRDCVAALSRGGTDTQPNVDLRLTRDPEPAIVAVQLAFEYSWDELGLSLGTELNRYLTSTGRAIRTRKVDGFLVDYYVRHGQPEAAIRTLLDASERLRVAGLLPNAETSLLTAAAEAGQQALDLARRHEIGEDIPHAAFAISLAAAAREDWERALQTGTTAVTTLLEQGREDESFPVVINLSRFAQEQTEKLNDALKWANKAVEMRSKPPFDTAREMAFATFELGRTRGLLKEYPAALLAYEEAANLFERAGDFTNAAIAAGNAGNEALRAGKHAAAIRWYERGIELWQRAEHGDPIDEWRLAIQRVGLSAAHAACGALVRGAETLNATIGALTASQAAPPLLVEAQVRLAALSLFLDDQPRALSPGISYMGISDEAAREAHVAWELDVLRKYRTKKSRIQAREKIYELVISPARNSAPVTSWYFQRFGEKLL